MRESKLEKDICKEAKADGWFVRKVQWVNRKNACDRLFIKDGRHVWIEFKAPGEPARKSQEREHQRMIDAGAEVYVCDNYRDARRILCLM